MVDVTLSRAGASVDISLFGGGGDLLSARDVGKPTQQVEEVGGKQAARSRDHSNAQSVWTIAGVLIGQSAYSDAKKLAEDIVVPWMKTDKPLSLDLSSLSQRGTYSVVPATKSSCTLTYVPGKLDVVGVQLGLAEVDTVLGKTEDDDDQLPLPVSSPGSGRGIRITRQATGDSIDLTVENAVTRKVGRPSIKLNRATRELPVAVDQNKPASDIFELSGVLVSSAHQEAKKLEESIILPPLADSLLSLEFLGNEYGLAKYDVVPVGSQSLRTSINAGQKDIQYINKLELRTIDNS